ncbi:MAG: glycosyltransferase family protein, partial [Acidimicrobiia bacterium]
PRSRQRRILLYSHDTYGLGHLRRTMRIAARLSELPGPPSTLLVTGSPRAHSFGLPRGCDVLKLPAVTKTSRGAYRARHLDIPLGRLVAVRSELIRTAVRSFDPHLIVIDHAPLGMGGELRPMLADLALRGHRPQLVLGLRDVIDDAARVEEDWTADRIFEVLQRDYDRIFVYGDPAVLTTAEELGLRELCRDKLSFTGYLAEPTPPDPSREIDLRDAPLVVTVGGGGDGQQVLRAYARWLASRTTPAPFPSVVITGPLLSDRRRAEIEVRLRSAGQPVEVLSFTKDFGGLLQRAAGVISMGGYNTVTELLTAEVPALIFPRSMPRREQLVRAERLASVSGLSYCPPDADPVEAIDRFVIQLETNFAPSAKHSLRLDGLTNLTRELAGLLGLSTASLDEATTMGPNVDRLDDQDPLAWTASVS